MKLGNFNQANGRQIHQDDLEILQSELYIAVQDQYKGQGAFILNGCLVTGSAGNYTIGAGLVYVDGLILKFDQITSIASLPRYIHQATPLQQDLFSLELGGTAYKRTLYKSESVSSIPSSGEYITITTTGGRTFNDVLANQFLRLSGNQTVNGTKTFSSTIVGSVNGNAHTVDNGVYTNTNNTLSGNNNFTGSNTFSNTINGNISGNASFATSAGNANTVTNGAYINVNNTFTGNNTFTNTINGNISGNAATATNAGNASTVTNGVYTNSNNTFTGNNTFNNPINPVGGTKTADGRTLFTKVIDIGDWNMDLNYSTIISLGFSRKKIRSIDVIIRDDNDNIYSPLIGGGLTITNVVSGGVDTSNIVVPSDSINLYRVGGGNFDLSTYSATGYNRGWVTIQYEA